MCTTMLGQRLSIFCMKKPNKMLKPKIPTDKIRISDATFPVYTQFGMGMATNKDEVSKLALQLPRKT